MLPKTKQYVGLNRLEPLIQLSLVNLMLKPYFGATDNIKLGIAGNNQVYSSADTVAKTHKVPYVKSSSKAQSQPSSKLLRTNKNPTAKNLPQTWGSGSVTGVVTKILSNNRFHVLQHLDADDLFMADTNTKDSMQNMPGCINQPILAKQVKNELQHDI